SDLALRRASPAATPLAPHRPCESPASLPAHPDTHGFLVPPLLVPAVAVSAQYASAVPKLRASPHHQTPVAAQLLSKRLRGTSRRYPDTNSQAAQPRAGLPCFSPNLPGRQSQWSVSGASQLPLAVIFSL